MRDEQTNEFYLPLTSTVVLKWKQKRLLVPLDFENNLTVVALIDSGAYVSAINQNELNTIKQKAPSNTLKINEPPNFQIQVTNGHIEKPLVTATLEFENGDNILAERSVVMKKIKGPIIGLNFMMNNSVVIDTTHGLILFPHLTTQVKTATSETNAKLQHVLTDDAQSNLSFCRLSLRTEHNRYCDTIGEFHGKGKSADFPLNIANDWQKSSNHYI